MDLGLPKVLLDAGGWVFAAAVLAAIITALIRGDLVTGKSASDALGRETKRADKATEQLERNSEIGEKLVLSNDKLTGQVDLLIELLIKFVQRGPS